MSRIMAPPLSAAINEFLQWLELDRHASAGTVAEYRAVPAHRRSARRPYQSR